MRTLATGLVLVLAMGPSARSEALRWQGDWGRLDLGGYVRMLEGMVLPRLEGVEDDALGLHGAIVRLAWRFDLGSGATVEIHDRLQHQAVTDPPAAGQGGQASPMGIGVSTAPVRTVDLSTTLVDTRTQRLEHDIDRLALRLDFDGADVAVGRQAITWGRTLLFQVADLWAAMSPFDLDTSEKRGIDAIRVISSLGPAVEIEGVVADRGSLDNLSGGVGATFYLDDADLWFGAARAWDQALLLAGISAEAGSYKLRAEGAWPYDESEERLGRVRATLGADWLHPRAMVTVEVHHNGMGAGDPDGYGAQVSGRHQLRGETVFLGRWYAGLAGTWRAQEIWTLSMSLMTNLDDQSGIGTLRVGYDPYQDVTVALGALGSYGERPKLTGDTVALPSEFGAYGHLVYGEIAWFF